MKTALLFAILCVFSLFSLNAADAPPSPPPTTDVIPDSARVSFVAAADGNPAPTFEWFKDGQKVGDGPTFVIETFTAANAGSYTIKATNPLGSAVSPPYVLALGSAPANPTIKIQIELKVTVSTATNGTAGR
jgi:hypothetical protein